jgi:hypothetical protein
MLRLVTADEVYARVLRQAAHDAVRVVLAAPAGPATSSTGSAALRGVTSWLLHRYGAAALQDLAEELAVDLAEAFDALASVECRDPLTMLDAWFSDESAPGRAAVPEARRDRPAR